MPQLPAYYVLDDNTLGYVQPEAPATFCPLASNVDGLDWKNGPVTIGLGRQRLTVADQADFARFRVDPAGHLPPIEDDEDNPYDRGPVDSVTGHHFQNMKG